MNRSAAQLSQKIQSLSEEQIAQVEDFVEFLRLRSQDRALTHAAVTASGPAFEAVWNNPEDQAYDAL